jgi:hypothetical protein
VSADGKDFHQGALQLNGTVLLQDESGFQNMECHFSTLYWKEQGGDVNQQGNRKATVIAPLSF